ncbi:MAG TPA: DUF2231 domain-containing protein [Acidimicrobiia bacterium]|nr:DUF2231 domain-containing protein [Acidimicrobiia bacterium]
MRTAAPLEDLIERLEHADALDGAVGRLQEVARGLAAGGRGPVLQGEWLGHAFHPLMTDFPLGCWIGAGLLDIFGGRGARDAARRLVGMGLLAVPLTAATGMADWSAVDNAGPRRVGAVHMVGNVAVGGAYFLSWRARRRGHHALGVGWALAGGSLAWVTGYLGGHLSFARGVGVGARGLEVEEPVDDAASVAHAS